MKQKKTVLNLYVIVSLLMAIFSGLALAHPEDEFCGDADMDPLLCAQLEALDRPAEKVSDYPLPDKTLNRSLFDTGLLYVKLGVEHIVPMGLDHLLFVLALLLSSSRLKSLIVNISLFTLAHSITLIMGVLGVIVLQGLWVEVAIALSIVFVAVENLLFSSLKRWRFVVVFGFGLLHGLGFAGALSEIGIPGDHYVSALLGFNVGVEIGQLGFALLVFVFLYPFMKKTWYKKLIVTPISLMIALVGLYWAIERIMGI